MSEQWKHVWFSHFAVEQKSTQHCQLTIPQLKNTQKNKLPSVRRLISDRLWTWNSIQSWTLSIQPFQGQDRVKHVQRPKISLRGSRWSHSLDYLLQQTDGVNSSLEAKRLQTQEGLMFQLKFKGSKSWCHRLRQEVFPFTCHFCGCCCCCSVQVYNWLDWLRPTHNRVANRLWWHMGMSVGVWGDVRSEDSISCGDIQLSESFKSWR